MTPKESAKEIIDAQYGELELSAEQRSDLNDRYQEFVQKKIELRSWPRDKQQDLEKLSEAYAALNDSLLLFVNNKLTNKQQQKLAKQKKDKQEKRVAKLKGLME